MRATLNLCIAMGLYTLLLASCQPEQGHSQQQKPEPADTSLCDKTKDFLVFNITASLWQESWKQALTDIYGSQAIQAHEQFIKSRRFSKSKVMSLMEQCPQCPDVRFYFAQHANPPGQLNLVPDLIMVNADGCQDMLGDSVLLADSSGTLSLSITQATDDVERWTNNWPEYVEWLRPIRAYTFERNSVLQAMNAAGGDNLEISYVMHAARSLQPNPLFPHDTNSIQGFLETDLILKDAQQGVNSSLSMDFAQPCPKLCDKNSPLYKEKQ